MSWRIKLVRTLFPVLIDRLVIVCAVLSRNITGLLPIDFVFVFFAQLTRFEGPTSNCDLIEYAGVSPALFAGTPFNWTPQGRNGSVTTVHVGRSESTSSSGAILTSTTRDKARKRRSR